MYKILFIRSNKAVLPEIDAYISYFNSTKDFEAYDSSKIKSPFKMEDFDVIWEFKGIGGIKTDKVLVHEYVSLSTALFPKLKNKIKNLCNYKPDLRVFLNKNVREEMLFKDTVPYTYRDMGVDDIFFKKSQAKEYDFVYIGEVTKDREMDKFLDKFSETIPGTLCLIGNYQDELYNKYKENSNIIFTGKVPYQEVSQIASKAIYGINFIPDKYPYNIQTSTKLLEYLAMDLKIITTDYKWINHFEKKYDCSFYKLDNTHEINIDQLKKFNFKNNFPENEFLWKNIIRKSDLEKKLLMLLEQKDKEMKR